MRRLLQAFGWLLVLAVGLGGIWAFGPTESVPRVSNVPAETDLTALAERLATSEARFDDITPGTQKRIIFAREPIKTEWSVVYVHGFSATSEEIRPVPDRVAQALGANLFYTRLTGHGRGGVALAEAKAADWIADLSEALAIGRSLGHKVMMMGTSTGGALVALSARDILESAEAYILISPNFELQAAGSGLLTLPFARYFVPLLVGKERSWEPYNERHREYWTTSYPTKALVPMAAVTQKARKSEYSHIYDPALVFLSDADTVVSPQATRDVMAGWGGSAEVVELTMGEGDDPDAHVIAGDIMSPGQTDGVVAKILSWLENQP